MLQANEVSYIADRIHWSIKVDLVNFMGDPLRIGPIPKQASFLGDHCSLFEQEDVRRRITPERLK